MLLLANDSLEAPGTPSSQQGDLSAAWAARRQRSPPPFLHFVLDARSTPGGPTEGGAMSKPKAGNPSPRRGLGGALTI